VGLVCVLGAGFLAFQGWRRARENHFLTLANHEQQYNPVYFTAMRHAAEIEPRNAETAYNLGEGLRRLGWDGGDGADGQIRESLTWLERAAKLNPYDPYNPLRIGMCLDWQNHHAEAAPYFQRALALDPNSHYMLAHMGWHYVQVEDYATAKQWFLKSAGTPHAQLNPIARIYLDILRRREQEQRKP